MNKLLLKISFVATVLLLSGTSWAGVITQPPVDVPEGGATIVLMSIAAAGLWLGQRRVRK